MNNIRLVNADPVNVPGRPSPLDDRPVLIFPDDCIFDTDITVIELKNIIIGVEESMTHP